MNIKNLAEKYNDYIIEQRRLLHSMPELSLNEIKTTKKLIKELTSMGIEVISFPDYNGCIGIIKGGKPGKTVMLRADIDGLPVKEKTGLPYAATNGNMHACGHDTHMSVQLGAARILEDLKDELHGTVKLLFQSGEEVGIGAKYYVDNGYLDDVDAVYGTHIWSQVEAGKFNLEPGERMASCDTFKITVKGSSSHGSAPNLGNDALYAAASIVMNIQSFVSRRKNPLDAAVVTVGTMNGGQRFNIIANNIEMEGTTRAFNKDTRDAIEGELRKIAENTAKALGVTAELEYNYLTDPIINENEHLNKIAKDAAIKLYGEESLASIPKVMGAEDFSHLEENVPGFFGFIGCYNEKIGAVYNNHSEFFKIDESTLHMASALAAQFAYDFLNSDN
ncbi:MULTISPECIES: amidohydrolase [unclassified Sedimentibacter]|uniref:amidohydrolase n=1 Tax=unclassified Sedimentibacter TaxID=2649220 RepID=UPI0027E003B6|nr:amidohydrolase [Sedimentibacter sp. MB35-C1]WMJ77634.1 amidohydrolase [Sedimentibacter sp. MB35-C1]